MKQDNPGHNLTTLGFDATFEAHFTPHAQAGRTPARVITEHPGRWRVAGDFGERLAVPAGRLRHGAAGRGDLPAVGDWVAIDLPADGEAVVHAVLPRRGKFSRRAVGGEALEQIVAANVDVALIVAALNHDFNPRRIERYVAAAWDGGAQPVVVLSKADLCADVEALVAQTMAVAPGADVVAIATLGPLGIAALAPFLRPGKTLALMGSSGAGKSTLTNALLGEARMATQDIREGDDRGRHTTTARELLVAPSGVIVIDTPGMRELGRWEAGEGLGKLFADVEAIVAACRFHDCGHRGEPGCAVAAALAGGTLDEGRWGAYEKLLREEAHQARRVDMRAALEEKARWKQIHKASRSHFQQKYR